MKSWSRARRLGCSLSVGHAAVLALFLILSFAPAGTHPGGRDSHGGHRVRQTGRYHFHAGALAGQEFDSKEAALAALKALEGSSSASQPVATSPPTASHPSSEQAQPATAPASGKTLTLASWNVRNLSTNGRSDAELGILSLILFRYDFIALQEVLDSKVVERVQRVLKEDFRVDYGFDVSPPVGHRKKERYAFLWRTDRGTQLQPGALYADPGDKFEREPFCASFRAGTFDWTECTMHLLFGNSKEERRSELLQLDEVYHMMRDAGNEKDVIICGDFNFGPDDKGWNELKAADGMRFAIAPPGKTTIGDKSLYDNCRFVPTLVDAVLRGSPLEGLTDPGAARGDDLFVDVRLGSSGPFRHDKRMVTLSNHMHRYRHNQPLQCPAQQLKGTQGITGAGKEQHRHNDAGQVLSA